MRPFRYTAITLLFPFSSVISAPLEFNGANEEIKDKTISCIEPDGCLSRYALSANNSNVSISSSTINHNVSNQVAIDSYKSNLILNDTNVTVTGNSSGLLNASIGEVTINGGTLNYSAAPTFGLAVISASYGSKVNLNNVNMDFTSTSETGSFLANKDSSQININGGKINSSAGTVFRALEGSINVNGVNVISGESNGYLADVNNNGNITISNSDILHKGLSDAIWLSGNNAKFDMESSRIITVSQGGKNNSSSLINSLAGGTTNINKSYLQTDGNYSRGIESKGITTINNSSIITNGEHSDALLIAGGTGVVKNTKITTKGDNSHGISLIQSGNNNKKVSIENSSIYSHGQFSSALSLSNLDLGKKENSLDIKNSTFVTDNSPTIVIKDSSGALNFSDSKILRNGDGESIVISHSTPDTSINFGLSDSIIHGDIVSNGVSDELSLNKTNLHGSISNLKNVNLSNSVWSLTKDSSILGDLFINNSSVEFYNSENFYKLSVGGSIYGNGNYILNTDLSRLKGDLIDITGNVYGENTVLIKNTGKEPEKENQRLRIILSGGDDNGNGDFKLKNKDGYVNVGTYQYELVKDNSTESKVAWDLVNTGRLSDSASTAADTGSVALSQSIWIEQINNLRKRLGNLRGQHESNGAWIRTYGSKLKLEQNNFTSQKVRGVATGYDFKAENDYATYFTGVRYDYAVADQVFINNGNGNVYGHDLAAYITYLFDNGSYIDSIISIGLNKNINNVEQTDLTHIQSKYNDRTIGLSTEIGKNIKIGSGWFIEPQLELNYLAIKNTSYSTGNDLDVNLGVGQSLTSRIGGAIGKNIKSEHYNTELYLHTGLNSQLISSRNIEVNSNNISTNKRGNSVYVGLGLNYEISGQQMLYANFDYERGNGMEKPISYNIGFRQSW